MPPKTKKEDNLPLSQSPRTSTSANSADTQSSKLMSGEMQTFLVNITAAFTSSFNICVEKIIDALDKRMTQKIDQQAVDIFDVNKRIEKLEKSHLDLTAENANLKDMIKSLTKQHDVLALSIDDMEQYSKGTNLLVHGLPSLGDPSSPAEADLEKRVIDYLNSSLNVSISSDDINAMHRLPKAQSNLVATSSGASNLKPPPVLIQFCNRKRRNEILTRRKLLKGKGISLTEQLTVKKAQLLKKAGELVETKKINSTWAHDGKILAKTLANRTLVLTPQNINNF